MRRYDDGEEFTAFEPSTGRRVTLRAIDPALDLAGAGNAHWQREYRTKIAREAEQNKRKAVRREIEEAGRCADKGERFAKLLGVGKVAKGPHATEIGTPLHADFVQPGEPSDSEPGDHAISRLADLLVESGRFVDRPHALRFLLHHPNGHALVRTHKAAKEERPMDTVHSIMKDGGIAATCAHIIAKGTTTFTQDELVEAATAIAAERWPELSPPQAFAKIFEASTDEARCLRQAINVAKESLILGPGLPVQVVTGPAARDVDDPEAAEAARAELMRIGRKQWPRLPAQIAFEQAFTDPKNATLVARLYHRPVPTTIYPMPREWLRSDDGSQHTKSDHGSAYGELMAKAEQHRIEHPELSIAQCFEKIFTSPANAALAKRERIESASR